MDSATRAGAAAGVEQEVVIRVVFVEAYLAGVADGGAVPFEGEDDIVEVGFALVFGFAGPARPVQVFAHVVLYPAQLYRHSGNWIVLSLRSLNPEGASRTFFILLTMK